MTRQVALLLALGSLAAAGAIVSFGTWILLRRGRRRGKAEEADGRSSAAPGSGRIAD
ncbi:MAG TPA: hypothetical protein VE737_03875 [Actinomycetota bacterium]|jgi:hypothetical protein|nr:hypothetical protein [Actinomycetota bacterium]